MLDGVRGSGVTSTARNTAAGPVSPLFFTGPPNPWITVGIEAVTISGTITVNFRGAESNAMANAGPGVEISRCDSAGVFISYVVTAFSSTTEFTTTEAAQSLIITPTSTTFANGDRINVRFYIDDAGGTMASGYTCTLWYAGTSAAASGDTYATFTETIIGPNFDGGAAANKAPYIGGGYYPFMRSLWNGWTRRNKILIPSM